VGTDQPKVPGTKARLDVPASGPVDRKAGLENQRPGPENLGAGPTADLRRRANHLTPGHPSSPVEADGRRKPPAPRLKDIALPEPLTDAEHAEHVKDVRDRLDKARVRGLATDEQHTIDTDPEAWDKERRIAHGSIIATLYSRASDVPCEHKAIIAGGLSGAGKSTVLDRYAGIDRSHYMTVNPDQIKEELADRGLIPHVEGLTPMEASDLVHEESSHIAKQLAMRAQADGNNFIWDVTMCSKATTERRIAELRTAGYTMVEGVFVDITVEAAATRSDARYREGHDDYRMGKGLGGRFIPEEVIRAQVDPEWGSVNRKTFEAVKGRFDSWTRYENSGTAPVIKDTGHRKEDTS
jgi:predicted ABC-type ATPase